MEKINKNDKIKSLKYGTFHVVDEFEIIDGITLIYTEDSKCFPNNDIEKMDEIEFYKNSLISILKDNPNLFKIEVDESPEEYFNRHLPTQKKEENKKFNDKINDFLDKFFAFIIVVLVSSSPIVILYYIYKLINLIWILYPPGN